MMQLSSKNNDSSFNYDVIIKHQNFEIDNFDDFSITVGQTYLEMFSPL